MIDKKKLLITATSVFILTVIFLATVFLVTDYKKINQTSQDFFDRKVNTEFLQIADKYQGSDLTDLFDQENGFTRVKDFNNTIKEIFDFYEIDKQDAWILENYTERIPYKDEFRSDYDSEYYGVNDEIGIALQSIQIGDSAYEYFKLNSQIFKGTGFSYRDFIYQRNKAIPIILGNEYTEVASIGDTGTLSYFSANLPVEVIGFLEKDSYLTVNGSIIFLDRKIVIPYLDVNGEAQNMEEQTFFNYLYSSKNWGFILTNPDKTVSYYMDEINQLNHKLNLKYIINGTTKRSDADNVGGTIGIISNAASMFSLLIILSFLILFFLITIWSYRDSKYVHAIYIICGCSLNRIKRRILLSSFTKGCIALFLSGVIYSQAANPISLYASLPPIIIIWAVIQFIIMVIMNYYINHHEIFQDIKNTNK